MIEIIRLKKKFGKNVALDEVSLSASPGSIVGVMGPNGCGKSTLIKSILGLVIPDSGDILICDKKVDSSGVHRAQIGYVPQNPEFPGNLRVHEIFDLVENMRGLVAPIREELVAHFKLDSALLKPISTLSGGTKQKVAMVLAFMFESPVLILDEPSVGLDPVAAQRLKELLRDFALKKRTILLVSHLVSETEQLIDDMCFLVGGRMLFSGSVTKICESAGASNLHDAVLALIENKYDEIGVKKP